MSNLDTRQKQRIDQLKRQLEQISTDKTTDYKHKNKTIQLDSFSDVFFILLDIFAGGIGGFLFAQILHIFVEINNLHVIFFVIIGIISGFWDIKKRYF